MSARLAAFVVRRPWVVLVIAALVLVAVTPVVVRIRLDTNLVDLLPSRSPEAEAFARFTELFGSEQLLVVLVEGNDDAALRAFADRLAGALRDDPDVAEVRYRVGAAGARLLRDHLVDLLDDEEQDALLARGSPEALARQARRLRGLLSAPGASQLQPMLVADPLELLPLVEKRLRSGLPIDPRSGYFQSVDGGALVLFVRPRPSKIPPAGARAPAFDSDRDARLLGAITAHVETLGGHVGEGGTAAIKVGYTGAPAYALAYRDWIRTDMQRSTTLSTIAVLLFFGVLLGAVRVLPLVAIPLGAGLWVTAALAVALYGRVNAVSLAFGTILVSIGIDLPIQLYNRLRDELSEAPTPLAALERTVERLAAPALVATLGPAAVFFACALSRYRGLAELGVLAALGLLVNLAAMLTVLPSLFALVPARAWLPRRSGRGQTSSGAWFAALGRAASRRPRVVLGTVLLVCVALLPAAARVRIDRRLLTVEPAEMEPARVRRELEHRFGGRDQLLVVLANDRDPDRALEKSDRLRAQLVPLAREGLLAGYESVSSLFPSRAEVMRRRARLAEKGGARIAGELGHALDEAGFDSAPFAGFLAQLTAPAPPLAPSDAGPELAFLVDAHVKRAADTTWVSTYLYPAPGRLAETRARISAILAEHPGEGTLTGQALIEDALYEVVRHDAIRVTIASVLAVALLLALFYRRLRPTLAVLVPLAVAWTLFAAALGLFGLPLNLFDLLTVPLVIGYGIDDHVFLVHRHEEDPGAGPARSLASTGRAIVVTSLSTMAGFAGLAAARFDGLRLLGITGALAVALCLLAAFAVLPALLALLYPVGTRLISSEKT